MTPRNSLLLMFAIAYVVLGVHYGARWLIAAVVGALVGCGAGWLLTTAGGRA